jgi:hypothetical protein
MTRTSRRRMAALVLPISAVIACAATYGILELAGANCYPDKIWGDCNVAAHVQFGILYLGAFASVVALVVVLTCGIFVSAQRHRGRGAARDRN